MRGEMVCATNPGMNNIKRAVAAADVLLLAPALLFMGALIVRMVRPLQFEPAHTAQALVMWYAGRMWTLWVLLITLPLVVLTSGGFVLLRVVTRERGLRQVLAAIRAETTTGIIVAAAFIAAAVLAVVAAHMMMN